MRRLSKAALFLRLILVLLLSFVLQTLHLAYRATHVLLESKSDSALPFEPDSRLGNGVGDFFGASSSNSAKKQQATKAKALQVEYEKIVAKSKEEKKDVKKDKEGETPSSTPHDGKVKELTKGGTKIHTMVQQQPTASLTPALQMAKNKHEANFGSTTYKYELSAVVLFRLNNPYDPLNFTSDELKQWMAYMSYAGVQHFYTYDNCQQESECQTWLEDVSKSEPDMVTYTRWPLEEVAKVRRERRHEAGLRGLEYMGEKGDQYIAYMNHWNRKTIRTHKARFEIICDIDEYPFMPSDTSRDFLLRFAQNMEEDQTLLSSMYFYGKPNTDHKWRTLRYLYNDKKVLPSSTTKYIYRTSMIDPKNQIHTYSIHWLNMLPWSKTQVNGTYPMHPSVTRLIADPSIIRLNHYKCERKRGIYKQGPVLDDTIRLVVNEVMKDEALLKRLHF